MHHPVRTVAAAHAPFTALCRAVFAVLIVLAACDNPDEIRHGDNCSTELDVVDMQSCSRTGDVCPLDVQPGTVCADGGGLAASATCTCSASLVWDCDGDAALFCSQPACSFGAPCTTGETCMSASRGTELSCDPTGHFVDCLAGQTMTMGCDLCTCQDGDWVCSTGTCSDASDE